MFVMRRDGRPGPPVMESVHILLCSYAYDAGDTAARMALLMVSLTVSNAAVRGLTRCVLTVSVCADSHYRLDLRLS